MLVYQRVYILFWNTWIFFSAPPGHVSAEVCHLACQGPLCLLLLLHPSCHASFREVPSHGPGVGVMEECYLYDIYIYVFEYKYIYIYMYLNKKIYLYIYIIYMYDALIFKKYFFKTLIDMSTNVPTPAMH